VPVIERPPLMVASDVIFVSGPDAPLAAGGSGRLTKSCAALRIEMSILPFDAIERLRWMPPPVVRPGQRRTNPVEDHSKRRLERPGWAPLAGTR